MPNKQAPYKTGKIVVGMNAFWKRHKHLAAQVPTDAIQYVLYREYLKERVEWMEKAPIDLTIWDNTLNFSQFDKVLAIAMVMH